MANHNAINSSNPLNGINGGTQHSSLTTNGLLTGAGTSGITALAAATNGQIPIGTGSAPTLSTIAAMGGMTVTNGSGSITIAGTAGNMILIQTLTASASASLNFTTGITSTYNDYFFVISNLVPGSALDQLQMLVSTNGGSSWISTGYTAGLNTQIYTTGTLTNVNSTTFIPLSTATELGVTSVYNGNISCYNITNGTNPYFFIETSYQGTAGNPVFGGGPATVSSTTINAFQFIMSTGVLSSGSISLYGILY